MISQKITENNLTLDKIAVKSLAKITKIVSNDKGFVSRLFSMGAVAGTKVEVVRVQPFGGPLSIKILGSVFSLRQHEANQIAVELA